MDRGSWLVATTVRRWGAQWRLLTAVTLVVVLACTLVTGLGLLVSATEQGGIRRALEALPDSQSQLDIRLGAPSIPVAVAREQLDAAVAEIFGPTGSAESSSIAQGTLGETGLPSVNPASAYVGELEEITDHAALVAGAWSSAPTEVAIPTEASASFGLGIGDPVTVGTTTFTISGLYEITDPGSAFWSLDVLNGAGDVPDLQNPTATFYQPIHVFGPLVIEPGGMDAAEVPVRFLEVVYQPSFGSAETSELGPLIQRLTDANVSLRAALGSATSGVLVTTSAVDAVSGLATGLAVTRATVVVVSLLLLVLAMAAIAQVARLFTDSRAAERQLMRARGASAGQLRALAVVESLVIAVVAAAASPVLAALVYRLLAIQPAMVAAGMPSETGITPLALVTAAATALIAAVVLVLPLLRRAPSLAEGERARRGRRGASLARSGADLAVIVLAALAIWQLLTYKSVVSEEGTLALDPVLVAGPALVLLAGALLCVRLIPAASRIVEAISRGANGIIVPLAAWELGRRSQRAVAAVLLLCLAMAVGSFGLSYLATWKQSQRDQAAVAVGAPLRVSADAGTDGSAVLREATRLGSPMAGDDFADTSAGILALSDGARQLLDRGRVGEEGGSRINDGFRDDLPSRSVAIDGKVLAGQAQVTELKRTNVALVAIVQDDSQLLSTVALGELPADGQPHEFSATLPEPGLILVGLQVFPTSSEENGVIPDDYTTLLVGSLSVDGVPTTVDVTSRWSAVSSQATDVLPQSPEPPEGWQLALEFLPADDSSFSVVGWIPVSILDAIVSGALVDQLGLGTGGVANFSVHGVPLRASIVGTVPIVPGAASLADLAGGIGSSSPERATVVLDQVQLSRALAQAGDGGPFVTERWLDVADGRAGSYLASHKLTAATATSSELLGLDLQQSPLRVATQAALWLAIIAGGILAAIGFVMHTITMLATRRLEFAQLRAIGLPRRSVLGLLLAESVLLGVLGVLFGTAIGMLLVAIVGPIVSLSPSGSPPVPSVLVEVPAAQIAVLAAIVLVVVIGVTLASSVRRFAEPAELLRWGGDA